MEAVAERRLEVDEPRRRPRARRPGRRWRCRRRSCARPRPSRRDPCTRRRRARRFRARTRRRARRRAPCRRSCPRRARGRSCVGERVAARGREVVDHEHVVAALEQAIGEVRRDEARAAGDQNSRHLRPREGYAPQTATARRSESLLLLEAWRPKRRPCRPRGAQGAVKRRRSRNSGALPVQPRAAARPGDPERSRGAIRRVDARNGLDGASRPRCSSASTPRSTCSSTRRPSPASRGPVRHVPDLGNRAVPRDGGVDRCRLSAIIGNRSMLTNVVFPIDLLPPKAVLLAQPTMAVGMAMTVIGAMRPGSPRGTSCSSPSSGSSRCSGSSGWRGSSR